MTDWIKGAKEAVSNGRDTTAAGYLPRALAALGAAEKIVAALESHKEKLGGQAYIPMEEIAAYRKAME